MSNNRKKNVLIVILVVLCTFFLALSYKSLSNGIPLDSVKLSKEDKERFAIKIEDSNGDYIDYEGNTWPGIGYTFNEDESKCTTKNGEIINNVLQYTNGVVKVTTKKTVFCYLYFDLVPGALGIVLRSGDYTLYDTEANLPAGTFYRYSGAYDGKRNVIYADTCWQIFRTTKNDSIKMIYNGEPAYDSVNDKYTCDNSRTNTNHIGYTTTTMPIAYVTSINGNNIQYTGSGTYYFGTGYYYDEISGAYKLSGEVGPYNTYSDFNQIIGMYTCKNTTANADCSLGSIYYITRGSSTVNANALVISRGIIYDRIGDSEFDYYVGNNMASIGYMNNYKGVVNSSIINETVLTSVSLNSSTLNTWGQYYYGDRTEGDSNLYNSVLGLSITGYPQSWKDKYTLRGFNQSYTNSNSAYIVEVTNDSTPVLYYSIFSNNTTKDSAANKYLFGTGFTSNGDGTVTITGAKEISKKDWLTRYNEVTSGNYYCEPETYNYDAINDEWTCSSVYSVVSINSKHFSGIKVNVKYGYSYEERTATEQLDGKGRYKIVGDNNISNSLKMVNDWRISFYLLNNAHYTCFNEDGICDTVNFVVYTSNSTLDYIDIPSGKQIDDVIDEMLNNNSVNTNNSMIKDFADLWYKEHILNKEDINHNYYSSYLDTNEIFCNNRSINDLGGWSQTGDTRSYLYFLGYNSSYNTRVSCLDKNNIERIVDEFSVDSGNRALLYPIGLPSYSEMYLLSLSNISSNVRRSPYNVSKSYWLMTPSYNTNIAQNYYVSDSGNIPSQSFLASYGVRPSLSLNHNVVFNEGTGTMSDPWIASLPN